MKRCGNCGKYPFCKYIVDINKVCNKWIKRENEKVRKFEEKNN